MFKRLIILLLLTTYHLPLTTVFAYPENSIRVAIIQDTPSLRLKIKGFYELLDGKNKSVLYRGRNLNTTVASYKNIILFGNIKGKTNKLYIRTIDPENIIINDRNFRGDIVLIKKDNHHLLVVNQIELEDYIKGILYHEASHYWPPEALKAQAVVCRSYAFYQMQQNRQRDYDLTNDIYSQVYGGQTSERARTNKIVDETKGQVLFYKDKVFPAYFHATCGGHTEDASLIWNIDIAPLKGVVCGFCKESPHFNWHEVISLDEIERKLAGTGYRIKALKGILINGKDASGRNTNLSMITDKKTLEMPAKDFRNIIGPNIIRSTNFTLNIVDNDAVFEGIGWGHGAGLCQWGAYFMAKNGYNYQQILQYYYPESKVSPIERK